MAHSEQSPKRAQKIEEKEKDTQIDNSACRNQAPSASPCAADRHPLLLLGTELLGALGHGLLHLPALLELVEPLRQHRAVDIRILVIIRRLARVPDRLALLLAERSLRLLDLGEPLPLPVLVLHPHQLCCHILVLLFALLLLL